MHYSLVFLPAKPRIGHIRKWRQLEALFVKFDINQQDCFMPPVRQSQRQPVSQRALLRAVASSTAIETGQSIAQLEQKLKQPVQQQRFAHIKLAR
jgi:hypothetical protein